MTKIKLIVELEIEENLWYGDSEKDEDWFYRVVLLKDHEKDQGLVLHSNYIGDALGTVKVLEVL